MSLYIRAGRTLPCGGHLFSFAFLVSPISVSGPAHSLLRFELGPEHVSILNGMIMLTGTGVLSSPLGNRFLYPCRVYNAATVPRPFYYGYSRTIFNYISIRGLC